MDLLYVNAIHNLHCIVLSSSKVNMHIVLYPSLNHYRADFITSSHSSARTCTRKSINVTTKQIPLQLKTECLKYNSIQAQLLFNNATLSTYDVKMCCQPYL